MGPTLPTRARPPVPPGPYVVVGRGRAGAAAAAALAALAGPGAVSVWDDGARSADGAGLPAGVEILATDDPAAMLRLRRPGALVKSPGVPFDAPVVRAAGAGGIPVLDELELGWRLVPGPLVAVTGTNGKSTTAALVRAALAAAGAEAPLAGNTETGVPLSALAGRRPGPVVCEASSFQLEGCPELVADAAAFLNLTQDHLHRHGSMTAYGAAKAGLLVREAPVAAVSAIDVDDRFGRGLAVACERAGGRVVRFGRGPEAEYRLRGAEWDLDAGTMEIDAPGGRRRLRTRLPGEHNARNLTAAMALADGLGLDPAATDAALEREPGVPGRFERIDAGQPFDVLVDFAHNPEAVAQVLGTARAALRSRPGARLRAVVSASGGHDRGKRPLMGAAARRLADDLVLTEDNWRGEHRTGPLRDLLDGASGVRGGRVAVVPERRAAIAAVLRRARPGDVVVVAGRGAMPRLIQDMAGNGPDFDDRRVTREVLRELGGDRRP